MSFVLKKFQFFQQCPNNSFTSITVLVLFVSVIGDWLGILLTHCLCFEIDSIHITRPLKHCFKTIFKIVMSHCYPWLVHVFQHVISKHLIGRNFSRLKKEKFIFHFKCGIDSQLFTTSHCRDVCQMNGNLCSGKLNLCNLIKIICKICYFTRYTSLHSE